MVLRLQLATSVSLLASSFLGLFVSPEDGSSTFSRNVGGHGITPQKILRPTPIIQFRTAG